LLIDIVHEAARRRKPAEENCQEDEREQKQDTKAYPALLRAGDEEEIKRYRELADEQEGPQ
jgi:hypothetical protein